MSTLAVRSEAFKLALELGRPAAELEFLHALPAEPVRQLRVALMERLFNERARSFRRLGWLARWLPSWLAAWLCRYWLGPLLTARVAGEMPARRAAAIARHISPEFMADVGRHLDPRHARELLPRIPVELVVAVSRVLVARRDYVTISRFVQHLGDEVVRAVVDSMPDEAALLEVAFYLDSKNRLDHLVGMLPPERVRKAILIVRDPARRALWPKILALVTNVGYARKRELGELAAAQGDEVLDAIVRAAQEDELWEDLLPVVACLSPHTQRRVVNLPAIRDPAVMQRLVQAADRHLLWSAVLPLVEYMDEPVRAVLAPQAALLDRVALERIAYAALLGEHWDTLLDLVRRMPKERQRECMDILRGYGEVDPELLARLVVRGRNYGLVLEAARQGAA